MFINSSQVIHVASLQQSVVPSRHDRFSPAPHTEFSIEARCVVHHRLRPQVQLGGNLLVRGAGRNEPESLQLTTAQPW